MSWVDEWTVFWGVQVPSNAFSIRTKCSLCREPAKRFLLRCFFAIMFESFLSDFCQRVSLGDRPSLPLWTQGQFVPNLHCPCVEKDAERRVTVVAILAFQTATFLVKETREVDIVLLKRMCLSRH